MKQAITTFLIPIILSIGTFSSRRIGKHNRFERHLKRY